MTFHVGQYDVLIMRHDLDDAQKARCLSQLLDLEITEIAQRNISRLKSYNQRYAAFCRQFRFPGDVADRLLDSTYTRHFFPDAEIDALRQKWTQP